MERALRPGGIDCFHAGGRGVPPAGTQPCCRLHSAAWCCCASQCNGAAAAASPSAKCCDCGLASAQLHLMPRLLHNRPPCRHPAAVRWAAWITQRRLGGRWRLSHAPARPPMATRTVRRSLMPCTGACWRWRSGPASCARRSMHMMRGRRQLQQRAARLKLQRRRAALAVPRQRQRRQQRRSQLLQGHPSSRRRKQQQYCRCRLLQCSQAAPCSRQQQCPRRSQPLPLHPWQQQSCGSGRQRWQHRSQVRLPRLSRWQLCRWRDPQQWQ